MGHKVQRPYKRERKLFERQHNKAKNYSKQANICCKFRAIISCSKVKESKLSKIIMGYLTNLADLGHRDKHLWFLDWYSYSNRSIIKLRT